MPPDPLTCSSAARLCLQLAGLCLLLLLLQGCACSSQGCACSAAMPLDGYVGPISVPSPWGKPWGFDAHERERIQQATGVSIAFRNRPQWGPGFKLSASGPINELERAIEMAQVAREKEM